MISYLQNQCRVSDDGLSMIGRSLSPSPVRSQDVIGIQFSIHDWLARARVLDVDAIRLQGLQQDQPPTPTRAAWDAWYASWRSFYDKYAGPNASSLAQSAVSIQYETFDKELRQRQSQFDSFLDEYNAMARAQGRPQVPKTPEPPPTVDSAGVPGWIWFGAGVLAVGAAYLVYRKVQEAQAKGAYLKKHGPGILDRFLPGFGEEAYGFSQAGRK